MSTPREPHGPPPPGWYADPARPQSEAGTPGLYRFWDGVRWTDRTSTHPSGGPPVAGKPRRRGLVVLALIVVVALVATVLVVRQRSDSATEDPLPSSTVSGFDDRSPTPTPAPDPSASTSPDAGDTPTSGQPSVPPVECDASKPDTQPAPPEDERVHGGPLSFARLGSPWRTPLATSRFPFSSDSYVQSLPLDEELPWQASAQVGLAVFDDYPGARTAAQTMLTCLLTSSFYTSVDVTLAENTTTTTTVSGTASTRVDALLTFEHPQLKTTGSLVRIIVVETDPVTYYFSAVPRERSDLIDELDRATRSLEVS